MKRSQQLKEQLSQCDNDLAAMGLRKQLVRAENMEYWEEEVRPKLGEMGYEVEEFAANSFRVKANGEVVSFFPSSKRLNIHRLNFWSDPLPRDQWISSIAQALIVE